MSDDLLSYYQSELAYLTELGGQFADAHPKIAGRLRMSAESIEDPHVSRLIQSIAFLNARTRRKLDDDFPEIGQALLSVLYPHFLAPIPSFSVVELEAQPDATAAYPLRAGSELESDRAHGEPCRFRTCYPVELWPFRLETARLLPTPFPAPTTPRSAACPSVLHLRLRCPEGGANMAELGPRSLRLFLKGAASQAHPLYELLRTRLVEIAVASSERDPAPALLEAASLKPVGFEPDQGLLPYSRRSFLGYRLLTELFAFPTKFLFLDLVDLPASKIAECGGQLDLYLYLSQHSTALENQVKAESFGLGCTPIVNLFGGLAEPIALDPTQHQYRVVPDSRRPQALEVYSVDAVRATGPDGQPIEFRPYFGLDHDSRGGEEQPWWYATREPAAELPKLQDAGSEVNLRLVDLAGGPMALAGATASVRCTFTNRELAAKLPFGGDSPRLHLVEGGAIRSIRCLLPPTPAHRPDLGGGLLWQLVSHLSLNHLSLTGGADAAQSLREMLQLYDHSRSAENRNMIQGLHGITHRPIVMRVSSGGLPGLVRGTEIALQLDEEHYTGTGTLLFGSVLERFFSMYCSVNTFVQTVLTLNRKQGEAYRWAPRAGDRQLI